MAVLNIDAAARVLMERVYGCMSGVVPAVRFDGGKPPHQVHFPTRPGWRWGWCDCPIGEAHNESARR